MGIVQSIKNIFRQGVDNVDNALKDPIRDGNYAIKDSKKSVEELRESGRKVKIQNVTLKTRAKGLEAKIATMQNTLNTIVGVSKTSEGAKAEEHKKNAKIVFNELQEKKAELANLQAEIAKNDALVLATDKQIKLIENKIDSVAQNQDRLKLRLDGAQVRQDLANAQSKYSGDGNPLAQLNDLEKIVEEAEAKAEVMDAEIQAQTENVVGDVLNQYADAPSGDQAFEELFR